MKIKRAFIRTTRNLFNKRFFLNKNIFLFKQSFFNKLEKYLKDFILFKSYRDLYKRAFLTRVKEFENSLVIFMEMAIFPKNPVK